MNIKLRDAIPADADALAHILITANDHAFRGLVPDQCLEFTEAESAVNWKRTLTEGLDDGEFLIVAQATTGEVVGYAMGGQHDDLVYRGELRVIGVQPDYQGRGVGRRLVCEVARRLADKQGIPSMRVSVLRINPNRVFYERLGGSYLSEHPYDWESVTFSECVYGWADTRTWLSSTCREGEAP